MERKRDNPILCKIYFSIVWFSLIRKSFASSILTKPWQWSTYPCIDQTNLYSRLRWNVNCKASRTLLEHRVVRNENSVPMKMSGNGYWQAVSLLLRLNFKKKLQPCVSRCTIRKVYYNPDDPSFPIQFSSLLPVQNIRDNFVEFWNKRIYQI